MRGSRIFRQGGGGPVQSGKKALTTFFFSPQLILLKSNGLFRRKLSFFKVPEGVQHFPRGGGGGWGGPTFSRGSDCLYPIETRITCDFPGGPDPLTPLDLHLLSRPAGYSFFFRLVVVGWYFSVLFKF